MLCMRAISFLHDNFFFIFKNLGVRVHPMPLSPNWLHRWCQLFEASIAFCLGKLSSWPNLRFCSIWCSLVCSSSRICNLPKKIDPHTKSNLSQTKMIGLLNCFCLVHYYLFDRKTRLAFLVIKPFMKYSMHLTTSHFSNKKSTPSYYIAVKD